MRIATFSRAGREYLGIVENDRVFDLWLPMRKHRHRCSR